VRKTLTGLLAALLLLAMMGTAAAALSTMAANKASGGPYIEYVDAETYIAQSGLSHEMVAEDGYVKWTTPDYGDCIDFNCPVVGYRTYKLLPTILVNPTDKPVCIDRGLSDGGVSSTILSANESYFAAWIVEADNDQPISTGYFALQQHGRACDPELEHVTGWELIAPPVSVDPDPDPEPEPPAPTKKPEFVQACSAEVGKAKGACISAGTKGK
jgi:hypothetical protein